MLATHQLIIIGLFLAAVAAVLLYLHYPDKESSRAMRLLGWISLAASGVCFILGLSAIL